MTGHPERMTVECPRCGGAYETWAPGAGEVDADPQLADPGWIDAHAAATCPACGHTTHCIVPPAERELWHG